jgi:hypothetical protein
MPRLSCLRAVRAGLVGWTLVAATDGCGRGTSGALAPLVDVRATVHRFPIDGDSFVLVGDDSLATAYVPDALPAAFRQEGLQVVFSAKRAPVPDNVRLPGIPVQLQSLRRADGKRPS